MLFYRHLFFLRINLGVIGNIRPTVLLPQIKKRKYNEYHCLSSMNKTKTFFKIQFIRFTYTLLTGVTL